MDMDKPRRKRGRFLMGGAVGALLAYFLDPVRGRSRRAQTKDRLMGLLRRGGRRAERFGRRLGAEAYGMKQKATHLREEEKDLDDATLAHKVESELFTDPAMPKGQINVNVEEGVVVLRGTAAPEEAESLTKATLRIPGVRGVENLLHLPGTPAPNKAAAREASRSKSTN
jgi:NAD-dependent oxidoreductase involved in siderophore biosynthesis